MKIDRLLGILMMIINREKITAKELSEYFHVSVRTIQRDIDTLSMSGIPIYAEVGKTGEFNKPNETFEEMVESCIPFEMKEGFTETEARERLVQNLKNLKRWM